MIYIPSAGVESWQAFLADPEKQWKTGYSAKALAHSWEEADGFPVEVKALFQDWGGDDFEGIEPIAIFPEHKVPLPGGRTQSQNDAFILARTSRELLSITVEGKVSESFGPTLGEWNMGTKGKSCRLNFLQQILGLSGELAADIRYQLLHRTASAVIEAKRIHASKAAMIVHSFSQESKWFEDYEKFAGLYGKHVSIGKLVFAGRLGGVDLYLGWAKGNKKYLSI